MNNFIAHVALESRLFSVAVLFVWTMVAFICGRELGHYDMRHQLYLACKLHPDEFAILGFYENFKCYEVK